MSTSEEKNARMARFHRNVEVRFEGNPKEPMSDEPRAIKVDEKAKKKRKVPHGGIYGNCIPIPTQSVHIKGSTALKRMADEQEMTQRQNGEHVWERVPDVFERVAAREGLEDVRMEKGPFGMMLFHAKSPEEWKAEDFTWKRHPCTVIDVKPMKRIRGDDEDVQDEFAWIELQGLHPDDPGWIAESPASHVAFEREEDFVVFPRSVLKRIFSRMSNFVNRNSIKSSATEAMDDRGVYVRRVMNDVWAIVPIEDMIRHDLAKEHVRVWKKKIDSK